MARTRLRQTGGEYTKFWPTLRRVYVEEGLTGVYRGLATQLVRQIPNTAIRMATYNWSSTSARSGSTATSATEAPHSLDCCLSKSSADPRCCQLATGHQRHDLCILCDVAFAFRRRREHA